MEHYEICLICGADYEYCNGCAALIACYTAAGDQGQRRSLWAALRVGPRLAITIAFPDPKGQPRQERDWLTGSTWIGESSESARDERRDGSIVLADLEARASDLLS